MSQFFNETMFIPELFLIVTLKPFFFFIIFTYLVYGLLKIFPHGEPTLVQWDLLLHSCPLVNSTMILQRHTHTNTHRPTYRMSHDKHWRHISATNDLNYYYYYDEHRIPLSVETFLIRSHAHIHTQSYMNYNSIV